MNDDELRKFLKELVSKPHENEYLEFKLNFHSEDEIGKNISALANSVTLHEQEFAYIVFGVDDKTHAIIGTDFHPCKHYVRNEKIQNWLQNNFSRIINETSAAGLIRESDPENTSRKYRSYIPNWG